MTTDTVHQLLSLLIQVQLYMLASIVRASHVQSIVIGLHLFIPPRTVWWLSLFKLPRQKRGILWVFGGRFLALRSVMYIKSGCICKFLGSFLILF